MCERVSKVAVSFHSFKISLLALLSCWSWAAVGVCLHLSTVSYPHRWYPHTHTHTAGVYPQFCAAVHAAVFLLCFARWTLLFVMTRYVRVSFTCSGQYTAGVCTTTNSVKKQCFQMVSVAPARALRVFRPRALLASAHLKSANFVFSPASLRSISVSWCSKKKKKNVGWFLHTHHLFSSFMPPAFRSPCVGLMLSGLPSLAAYVCVCVFDVWMFPLTLIHIKVCCHIAYQLHLLNLPAFYFRSFTF